MRSPFALETTQSDSDARDEQRAADDRDGTELASLTQGAAPYGGLERTTARPRDGGTCERLRDADRAVASLRREGCR